MKASQLSVHSVFSLAVIASLVNLKIKKNVLKNLKIKFFFCLECFLIPEFFEEILQKEQQ